MCLDVKIRMAAITLCQESSYEAESSLRPSTVLAPLDSMPLHSARRVLPVEVTSEAWRKGKSESARVDVSVIWVWSLAKR